MKTWTYLVLTNCNPSQLDNLGEDGWELVTVVIAADATRWFYFKREVDNGI